MPQNRFWTNKCLKIGLGQFFLTNWCTKIGFGQFGQIGAQNPKLWFKPPLPKTCELANTGLSLLCSWLLTCCLFFCLPPPPLPLPPPPCPPLPFPPNSWYNLNTCNEALQHMYRPYTVLNSVWLYLTPVSPVQP